MGARSPLTLVASPVQLISNNIKVSEERPWSILFNHDDFGARYFCEAAEKRPEAFIQHVLPIILDITDAAVYEDDDNNAPKRDAIWPILFDSEHDSPAGSCLRALALALEALAKADPGKLNVAIAELGRRDTYIANFCFCEFIVPELHILLTMRLPLYASSLGDSSADTPTVHFGSQQNWSNRLFHIAI